MNPSPNPHAGQPPHDGEAATALIKFRVTPRRKSAYVRAARPRKLSEWVFAALDAAAGYVAGGK